MEKSQLLVKHDPVVYEPLLRKSVTTYTVPGQQLMRLHIVPVSGFLFYPRFVVGFSQWVAEVR